MILSELDSYFRVLTSEPNGTTGRWSFADVANMINQARFTINAELDYPQGNISTTTISGQMEYELPQITKILRVYVGGQIIIKSSIPTLQGDQIEFYDQTGTNNAPQWNTQNAAAYPVTGTSFGSPYSNTLPFYQGARPQYYLRGPGVIGLVPPPAGAYSFSIDIIPRPNTLVNQNDVDSSFDEFFKEAIVQGAVMRAMQGDRDQDARMQAAQEYSLQMKRLQLWIADFTSGAPNGPIPVTYRGFYQNSGSITNDNY